MSIDSQPHPSAPLFRRLWVIVLLTCLLIPFPVAMVLLLTGDVYRWRDGSYQPIQASSRYVFGGLLALCLVALVLRAAIVGVPDMKHVAVSKAPAEDSHISQGPNADDKAPSPEPKPEPTAPADDSPKMRVVTEPSAYGPTMGVTADDDQAFTIQRVVFNGRANETGCDIPDHAGDPQSTDLSNPGASMQSQLDTVLPATLKRGQKAGFLSGCGEILTIDIYTDRGVSHLKVGGDN